MDDEIEKKTIKACYNWKVNNHYTLISNQQQKGIVRQLAVKIEVFDVTSTKRLWVIGLIENR